MNTPAHVVINLTLLSGGKRRQSPAEIAAVLTGALIPDLVMIAFYAYQRTIGTPERTIWRERYYDEEWQTFFDLFNSLPIIAAGWIAARLAGLRTLQALVLSMALHAALDFPLHHDDAHRHFWPLSDWRFSSPVSYWDPNHYGHIVGWIEIALIAAGIFWLWRHWPDAGRRSLLGAIAVTYAAYLAFVFTVWV